MAPRKQSLGLGDECSPELGAKLRDVMEGIRKTAKPPELAHLHLPPGEHRDYVRQYFFEHYLYQKLMLWWGKKEEEIIVRLKRILNSGVLDHHQRQVVQMLDLWKTVRELGWSYTMMEAKRSFTKNGNFAPLSRDWAYKHLKIAESDKCIDSMWFYELVLRGMPSPVADFRVIPKFAVYKSFPKIMERFVVLEGMRGERTQIIPWPAEFFCNPDKFRRWVSEQGRFTFGVGMRAGITELNKIQRDVNCLLEFRSVHEFQRFGWNELPNWDPSNHTNEHEQGVWIFRDGILFPDGTFAAEDKESVVSWKSRKFRIGDKGPDGQKFKLTKDPFWKPDLKIQNLIYTGQHSELTMTDKLTPKDHLRGFYNEFCRRLEETFGQDDWVMLVGGLLAFGSAPEVFKQNQQFPGLFIHGQAGSGKTCVLMWLLEIFGFSDLQPLVLRGVGTTAVGLEQAISQYGNIPLWADEFVADEVDESKKGVLRNAFGRGGYAKHGLSRDERPPSTMFVLSGENTSDNAALRGRYVHVFISKEDRKINHQGWFNCHRKWFGLFWREILSRRGEYVQHFKEAYADWLKWSSNVPDTDSRSHFVYGVGWSGFSAMNSLLGAFSSEAMIRYKQHFTQQMCNQHKDVSESTDRNQFWRDLLASIETRDIKYDWFVVEEIKLPYPQDASAQDQPPWYSANLYFLPSKIVAGVNAYRHRTGIKGKVNQSDIRSQLKPCKFFDGNPPNRRFGRHNKAGGQRCWKVSLDLHEMGYIPISDEAYSDWVKNNSRGENDPRRGELYVLVDNWKHFMEENKANDAQQRF